MLSAMKHFSFVILRFCELHLARGISAVTCDVAGGVVQQVQLQSVIYRALLIVEP